MTDVTIRDAATAGPTDAHGEWCDVAARIADGAAETERLHDTEGSFVDEAFRLIRDTGLGAAPIPVELGGGGATHAKTAAILTRLAHGSPSAAVALSMHYHILATLVWRHRHGLPAAETLQRVADRRLILVTSGASDWIDSSGNATKVEGGYRIDATKSPISGAPAGDVLVSSVGWDEGPQGRRVIHFAVPMDTDGIRIEPTWDAMGLRGTGSDTVILDGVFVPEGSVTTIRPAGEWHPLWSTVIGSALPLIMAAYVGIGETAVDQALALVRNRPGVPRLAELAGEMLTRLTIARDAVAWMLDASDDLHFDNTIWHTAAVLTRKRIAAESLVSAVRTALELVGGAAFTTHTSLERLFRDVHGCLFHPLPSHKQARLLGRLELGLEPLG